VLPASRRTRKAWSALVEGGQGEEAETAYCGDSDNSDGVGMEGGVPVGGAAEHDRLELGDACGGVDILDHDMVSIC